MGQALTIRRFSRTLQRIREHLRANREKNTESKALMTYAFFVAGVWWLVSVFAVFVCYVIASLVWDMRLSLWPALTISSAIWIVLAVKAHRRGYTDLCRFRLEVAFLLSLMLLMSLQPLFDLSKTTGYLLVVLFTTIWAVVHLSVRRTRKNRPRKG